jgi:hypothetical protein
MHIECAVLNVRCFFCFIQENGTTWKEVLPNVKLFGNEGAIIQEAAKIQDAYY